MSAPSQKIAVIDIGKTNAKVVLIDMQQLKEIEVVTRPNNVLPGPPYPHFDVEALWAFMLDALTKFQSRHTIDAITVTTHGAACALLDATGALAAPVLDYEHDGPNTVAAEYDLQRPPFEETGSPRLPCGLNLGAQLHWQFQSTPSLRDRIERIVTYPQYWTGRLTGNFVNEVTSLGCHTDLWNPYVGGFSSLVERRGWSELFAPVVQATDVLGAVSGELAARCGLHPRTPVYCGIHDSNASLYPHLVRRKQSFTVVSTGTWIICMAVSGQLSPLDPARDCLVNVNALGQAVPSSRFMGGREFELLMDGRAREFTEDDVITVLRDEIMLLPSVEPGSGPFQNQSARWTVDEASLSDAQIYVSASFYLAMMTATCIELVGGTGDTILEGPIAKNELFASFLASILPGRVSRIEGTGTSAGACLLADPSASDQMPKGLPVALMTPAVQVYFDKWKAKLTTDRQTKSARFAHSSE